MSIFAKSRWAALAPGGFIIPCLLGLALYFIFMTAVEFAVGDHPLVTRYLSGHWISRVTLVLAAIGTAALALNALSIWRQRRTRWNLASDPATAAGDDEATRANRFLEDLQQLPPAARGYQFDRVRAGLEYVRRTGAVDGLDEELKYLSDVDGQRQNENYTFVRILIWATPMLGFLGTVLGISQALGAIELGADNDFQQMINGLRGNLYVAFDTTALALTLSMVLMFLQFLVNRSETRLLEDVDVQSRRYLESWFSFSGTDGDQHVRAIHRIGRSVLAATHEISQKQIELWRRSIESAQAAWMQASQSHFELIQGSLNHTLHDSLLQMADRLSQTIGQLDQSLQERGQLWQDNLVSAAQSMSEQQSKATGALGELVDRLHSTPIDEAGGASAQLAELIDSMNLLSVRLLRLTPESNDADSSNASARQPSLRVVREDQAA